MENIGDMPPLVKVEFKGNIHYDNTEQITYWKNWAFNTYNKKATSDIENDNDLPF